MLLLLLVYCVVSNSEAARIRNRRNIVPFHGTTQIVEPSQRWPQHQSDAHESLSDFLKRNYPTETTTRAPMRRIMREDVEEKRKNQSQENIRQEVQKEASKEAEENATKETKEPEEEDMNSSVGRKRAMKDNEGRTILKEVKMEENATKETNEPEQEEAEEKTRKEAPKRAMKEIHHRKPETNTNESKIYFLFLAVDKISNMDVWNAFFQLAPDHQFKAYVHCKALASCRPSLFGSKLITVPTVPSYYCTDLVSPMNQLLLYALEDAKSRNNPMDKFVFVSDSTLPAKPFASVYKTLATRKGSDFCLFPAVEWADIPAADGGKEIAAKHHQWIVLEHAHATKSLQLWVQGYGQEFMSKYRMNTLSYRASNNSFADNRNFGCLDEFWHMLTIFGPLRTDYKGSSRYVNLADFNGGPIHISPNAGWQGMCDTFVVWEKYLHTGGRNPFLKMHSMLDHMSVPHGGNSQRPGWWDRISRNGIRAIRNSDFLFVRKFIDNPTLADGGDFQKEYSRLVFM
eukprot:gnl/TRDRNA2_/TRDRNA2_174025_c0_seq7.p1 gnl/TRDRNA2_/TRDRNA2_174025_c0~~gnl/TRDRNA2_/TRDRNA2_174025_c0_seq7.p1  ORF type:complete len:514 (+),score=94.84 gnl/TRDRNA2_/TRDRNA2_174025_c0_seq7:194-1735(+)